MAKITRDGGPSDVYREGPIADATGWVSELNPDRQDLNEVSAWDGTNSSPSDEKQHNSPETTDVPSPASTTGSPSAPDEKPERSTAGSAGRSTRGKK